MSQTDTKTFLIDLLLRFDPDMDLSEGSRAVTDLIEPILKRIGSDPFEQDIVEFIRERISQVRPDLAITEADELTDLLIDPIRVLVEPIVREVQLIKLRTSLNNIDALSDDEIDALMGNFFAARKAGGFAVGTVRAYFSAPQSVSVTLVHIAQSKSGLRFVVPRPQAITVDQMLLNIEGSEYYFDIAYIAESRGDDYNVERGEINSISNLPAATRVINLRRFSEGVARETNNEFVARTQQGTSDKTLTTAPGLMAVLPENFPSLRQLFEIGYGDPEMQRDVLYGGGLGPIPQDDSLGAFFGAGTPVDDYDADLTTSILEAPQGNFIARVAAVGSAGQGWHLTIVYNSGSLVVKDVPIVEVISDTRVRLAHEFPLAMAANSVTWMLRREELTVSGVPGGIALPDNPNGSLTLSSGEVHIGGKTDVFVAGEVEQASTQITGLTDETPLARGFQAQTSGATAGLEDIVILHDLDEASWAKIKPGMSLVLSEGADVGAYRIVQVQAAAAVRVDTALTGTQGNLIWKIVDELDVDLVTPKDVLLEGTDLVFSAGSGTVITSAGTNFEAAGARQGDVLYVDHVDYGGDYRVASVNAFALVVEPTAPRSIAGLRYVLSRRSEGVQRPVLRVRSLELLDSAGSPTGTTIPYRDPVMVRSQGFQNEGAGFLYEGAAFLGLVSTVGFSGVASIGGSTFSYAVRDPSRGWAPVVASGTFTFPIHGTVSQLVDRINRNLALTKAGIRGVTLRYGGNDYLGITSQRLVTITGGSALEALGWAVGLTNAHVRGEQSLSYVKVRRGDLLECVSGNNGGATLRVLVDPDENDRVVVGTGPLGPPGTQALYDSAVLSPDAGGRVRIGRPSVGSARCYFIEPTSINFNYAETRLSATFGGQARTYRPDPENARTLIPPPPRTDLPSTGTIVDDRTLEDDSADFWLFGVREGDLLDILYAPITSNSDLPDTAPIGVGGKSFFVQQDADPFIEVAFPYDMNRDQVVSHINTAAGITIASIADNRLVLKSSRRLTLSAGGSALSPLALTTLTNDHPSKGTFVVQFISRNALTVAAVTPFLVEEAASTHYRVRRYMQRVTSTEMNLNKDASGLYYADVEAVSLAPGEVYNVGTDVEMEITGYESDGYRLVAKNPVLSFSRAEDLHAEISRTVLLVGASDSPEDFVQLNLQNIQVGYDRSPLVDEVQSFVSSRYRRVLTQDILVRHLLPHYVSLTWRYSGGAAEPDMLREINAFLAEIPGGGDLEVGAMVMRLRGKQAGSVFALDPQSPNGRTAPQLLVVKHEESRRLKAQLVRDVVDTVRMATYLPDSIQLKRLSSAGLR